MRGIWKAAVVDAALQCCHTQASALGPALCVAVLRASVCSVLSRVRFIFGEQEARDRVLCCKDKCGLQPLCNTARPAGETLLVSSHD